MLATLRSSLIAAALILFIVVGHASTAWAIDVTVSRITGEISLVNTLETSVPIVGYSINSPSGALLPGNWHPIANNYDVGTGGSVDSNDEWIVIDASSKFLVEGEILGDGGSLAPGQVLTLGLTWDPLLPLEAQDLIVSIADGPGEPTPVTPIYTTFAGDFDVNLRVDRKDLEIWKTCYLSRKCLVGDADRNGAVNGRDYFLWLEQVGSFGPIPPPRNILGDFNDDGTTTAADYAIWRDNLGGSAVLPHDITPGVVNQSDYHIWLENFEGMKATGGGMASVGIPEPTSMLLMNLGLLVLVARRSGRCR